MQRSCRKYVFEGTQRIVEMIYTPLRIQKRYRKTKKKEKETLGLSYLPYTENLEVWKERLPV